jgi:nuclear pore complex protein Nup93
VLIFLKLVAGQPLWAKLYYLVRTGHSAEALQEAQLHQAAIDHREPSFVSHFKTWIESPDRRYEQTLYNLIKLPLTFL